MKRVFLFVMFLLVLSSPGFCQESPQTLQLSINSDQSTYKFGEAINITANIKNTGTGDAKIYSPAYWGVSEIVVKNSKGMKMNPAGLKIERKAFEQMMVISPGEMQSYVFEDLMWFHCGGAWQFRDEDRLKPDTYTIIVAITNRPQGQGECNSSAEKNFAATDFNGTLTSNIIFIEVLHAEISTADVVVPAPVVPVKPAIPDVTSEGRKIERVFFADGKLYSETDLFSDKYNGFYKTFHPSGQLSTEVRYKDGWQIYDKAFDPQGQPLLRNGIVKEYYGGGTTLASQGSYRNDMKNGEFKYYYYDGKTVVDVWHYMNGRKSKKHSRYDRSSNLISQEDWGYSTDYVQKLKYVIAILSIMVMVLLLLRIRTKVKQLLMIMIVLAALSCPRLYAAEKTAEKNVFKLTYTNLTENGNLVQEYLL